MHQSHLYNCYYIFPKLIFYRGEHLVMYIGIRHRGRHVVRETVQDGLSVKICEKKTFSWIRREVSFVSRKV